MSISCFAATDFFAKNISLESCGKAPPTSSTQFCQEFEKIAKCNCKHQKPNSSACDDIDKVYELMMASFHNSLKEACEYAADTQDTTVQECINDWNYFLKYCPHF